MPARKLPLVTDQIYHLFNRGNASIPIFRNNYDYQKFIQIFLYYLSTNVPIRYSKLAQLPSQERENLLEELRKQNDHLVEIIAYCLMPNHFHFVLKQKKDNGIMNFVRKATSSYSHYFNTKHKRRGSLFEDRFKAVRIESDNQLLHLTRYIHLNPYSSYIVKDFRSLLHYPFSSLGEYLGTYEINLCNKDLIFGQMKSKSKYKEFVLNRADYQKTLDEIKHKLLEN